MFRLLITPPVAVKIGRWAEPGRGLASQWQAPAGPTGERAAPARHFSVCFTFLAGSSVTKSHFPPGDADSQSIAFSNY